MSLAKRPGRLVDLIRAPQSSLPIWIGPALLPRNGKLLLGGEGKIGKTFLMLEILASMVTQKNLFGHPSFIVPDQGSVLLVDQELGEYGLKARVQDFFTPAELEAMEDKVHFTSKVPELQFNDPLGRKLLLDYVAEIKPSVLILDPLGQLHTYDENSATDMARLYNYLDVVLDAGKEWGMSLVLAHHFGKPARSTEFFSYDPLDMNNFRGSSKHTHWFDAILTAHRINLHNIKNQWRLDLRPTYRHGEPGADFTLRFNEYGDKRMRFKGELTEEALHSHGPPKGGQWLPAPGPKENDKWDLIKNGRAGSLSDLMIN